jgi:hypothetical protein
MGALDWSGTSYLEDTDYRWLGATYFDSIWDFALALTPAAHDKAHEWYRYTVYPDHGYEFLGFYFSPFQNGPIAPGKIYPAPAAPVSFALSAENNNALAASAGTSSSPLSGFQVFGAATESAGIWTIIEGSDAGIFLPVIFPPDATKVKFKYKWSGTADGDFLGVRFGVRPEAFMGLDLAVSRSDFLPAQVEIGLYAGLTDNLVFTLVSRGSPGAVLQLRDIEIVQDDDADRDGLTTAQELAIGTHCQNSDTDGDSIDDMAELNAIPPTNPIAADTDGDGVQDSVEIQAGTDPTNGQSFLRVTDMTKNTGGTFMLRWPSQAGRFYNVQRSADVSFATFDVIGQEMSATPPQNTFVDTSAGSAPNGRFFYRIEVYVP